MNSAVRIAIPQPTSTDETYNQRCWAQYAEAVEACGATPVSVQLHSSPAEIAALVSSCAGVILPGSPADIQPQKYGQETGLTTSKDDPARESADELLLQDAFNLRKPVLGVCYGLQAINVWLGGTLHQHLQFATHHDRDGEQAAVHTIALLEGARRLPRADDSTTLIVNSSHHQAVDRVGDGLAIAAISPDGVIEALEGDAANGRFVLGVQWHPERTFHSDLQSRQIFERFTAAAARWAAERTAFAESLPW